MTRKSCLKMIAALVLTAILISGAVSVLMPRILDLDSYKTHILKMIERSVKRPVSYKTASISWQLTPSFVIKGLAIQERSGDTNLLTLDRLTFKLALLPLLHNELRLQEIVLERPVLVLDRNQDGVFSINDLFSGPPSSLKVSINAIRITDGQLRITDHIRSNDVVVTKMEQLHLQVTGLTRGESSRFSLSTVIHDEGGREELSVSGTAGIPDQEKSLSTIHLDVALSLKNLNIAHYWPYYGRLLPFEKMQGRLDVEGKLKGELKEFTTKGSLRLKALQLNYPQVFHTLITPKQIDLSYELASDPRKFSIKSVDLKIDGLQLKGSGAVRDPHGTDPALNVQFSSSPLNIEELQRYLPYGVFPKGTADFLEHQIKSGSLTVEEGKIDGRISQILHLGQGTNYNALSVRATVDNGLLSFGPHVPLLSHIKTGLEFRGKDFSLHNMTGNFGESPFALEGKIAGYLLAAPASYPFSLSMSPAQSEVDWLLRQSKNRRLALNGPSELRLTGAGIAGDYRINGTWDLTGAAYHVPRIINKPAGMANRITFAAILGATETHIPKLRYELPALDVTANATYRYKDKTPLSVAVTTNLITLKKVLPVFPILDSYHPTGTLQAAFTAAGNPSLPGSFRWKGTVTLTDFSDRGLALNGPSELRLTGAGIAGDYRINGTWDLARAAYHVPRFINKPAGMANRITFSALLGATEAHIPKLRYELPALDVTANATYRYKDKAPLSGAVTTNLITLNKVLPVFPILDSYHPTGTLQAAFTAAGNPSLPGSFRWKGAVTLADFSVRPCAQMPPLSGINSTITISGQGLETGRITAKLGDSDVTFTGSVKNFSNPVSELSFSSPVLHLNDLGIASPGRDSALKNVSATLSMKNNQLDVKNLSVNAFGGQVFGDGKADLALPGKPHFLAHYRLDRLDVAQLFKVAGVEPAVTGVLSAEGKLTAQGSNRGALIQSADGALVLHLKKGIINKFTFISKIFSILNVSQFLELRLPDVTKSGMPHDSIDGTFAVKDGTVTTTDLTIASPAVKVQIVGAVDLVTKNLDLTCAVQPLQTVSKVVSRIPVVGWILTGGDKRFLVSFFDVQGAWEDPKVSAAPVAKLSQGVFNIFKRTFMLPEKLLTDPKKVIMH